MIDERSVEAVDAARLGARFARPLHGSWCFAGIPATVEALLGVGDGAGGLPEGALAGVAGSPRAVVLVLIDGFGWRALERHGDHPFLRRLLGDGRVAKLTAQFPSTTTAHLTTLYTGLPVGLSGLYEWNLYEPLVDDLICPLMWSWAGDGERETLARAGVDAAAVLPFEPVSRRLAAAGVEAHVVQSRDIGDSTYSRAAMDGALRTPFAELAGGLDHVGALLAAGLPTYAVVYVDEYDSTSHRDGPWSLAADLAARRSLDALEAAMARWRPRGEAVLLVTADHGQVEVDPARTVYVNRAWPGIERLLRRGRLGRPLAPAGSARDLFLHAADGAAGEVADGLRPLVAGRAEVHLVADLLDAGMFGPVSERLLARVGDIAVLPYAGETAWWHEPGRFEMRFRGHHGGLEPDEMHTFLAALPL